MRIQLLLDYSTETKWVQDSDMVWRLGPTISWLSITELILYQSWFKTDSSRDTAYPMDPMAGAAPSPGLSYLCLPLPLAVAKTCSTWHARSRWSWVGYMAGMMSVPGLRVTCTHWWICELWCLLLGTVLEWGEGTGSQPAPAQSRVGWDCSKHYCAMV